ncbi:porin family protein [Tahibacter soli]|jgi:hypothetical protein|uniref:Porin family protein n=1 Tax=Tahibacter soli TaxID=2983605 RepID=A0A9X3YHX4_9GAMM|nr:porin family protein [Tahibacter soli]MDC8011957.1 porin family protein [Tahibacter soli]
MKTKMVLALALGLAGVTALPAAMADGLFISGNVGQSDLKKGDYDKDTAFAINGGYRWGAFGLEAGYNDFGSLEDKYSTISGAVRDKIDLTGWNLGVNGKVNFAENWYVSGRAGVFRWDADTDFGLAAGPRTRRDEKGTDWYAGVGVGYDVNQNFGVGLAFDRFKADGKVAEYTTNRTSVTAEYRF